ncbi:MAG: Asp-tRNA(Asn)/Glu-tRNA(Gln) amidotransferase subunit GatC [Hyphomicrobiales bacterium]
MVFKRASWRARVFAHLNAISEFIFRKIPMDIDKQTVRHIAGLACIAVSVSEIQSLQGELSTIIGWFGKLNEVDTSDVEPSSRASETTPRMREDAVTEGDRVDDILRNAPASQDRCFVVPKVME